MSTLTCELQLLYLHYTWQAKLKNKGHVVISDQSTFLGWLERVSGVQPFHMNTYIYISPIRQSPQSRLKEWRDTNVMAAAYFRILARHTEWIMNECLSECECMRMNERTNEWTNELAMLFYCGIFCVQFRHLILASPIDEPHRHINIIFKFKNAWENNEQNY